MRWEYYRESSQSRYPDSIYSRESIWIYWKSTIWVYHDDYYLDDSSTPMGVSLSSRICWMIRYDGWIIWGWIF
jgi:hypothetical protein